MLFVLGGVGASELRDAREAAAIAAAAASASDAAGTGAADAPPMELLLAGTRLLTPAALRDLILA